MTSEQFNRIMSILESINKRVAALEECLGLDEWEELDLDDDLESL